MQPKVTAILFVRLGIAKTRQGATGRERRQRKSELVKLPASGRAARILIAYGRLTPFARITVSVPASNANPHTARLGSTSGATLVFGVAPLL